MSNETIDKKQKILLEMLISDIEVFAKCVGIMQPMYFDKPFDRAIEFIKEYYQKHHGIPKVSVIEAETGAELELTELDPSDKEYVMEELESFCQDEAMRVAILDSVDLLNDGKKSAISEKVREALLVKLDRNVGIDIFNDAKTRILSTEESVDERSIGIKALDEMLNKVRRAEVGVVYGSTGAGKSVLLGNIARNMCEQGLDVFVVSLELKEALYAKRLDTIITNTDIREHIENANKIHEFYDGMKDHGRVVVKFLKPQSTATDIRTALLEYELEYKKKPDVIIVDYMGLMGVEGVNSSQLNKFDFDEIKIFQLQSIATDYDAFFFTAGQLNRDAADIIDISPKHVAGGLSVVNGSDWSIAMVASDEDIDNNQFKVKQLKIRNGAKMTEHKTLYRSPKSLRVSDQPNVNVNSSPVKKVSEKIKEKSEKTAIKKPPNAPKSKPAPDTVDGAKGKNKLKMLRGL